MKKKRCVIPSGLLLLLVLISGVVLAGPPVAYDGWTIGPGTIDGQAFAAGVIDTSASCNAPGISCRTLAQGDGFLQEEINDGSRTFFRVILTEQGAMGDPSLSGANAELSFIAETYTPFATTGDTACSGQAAQDCQGLAAKHVVRDLSEGFETTALIQRNFAKSNATDLDGMYNIDISQTLDITDSTGLAFRDSFAYRNWTSWECTGGGGSFTCSNTLPVIGYELRSSQTVYTGIGEKQAFSHIASAGYKGRQAGGFFMSEPVRSVNGQLTLDGTTVPWNRTDDINTTWVGANTMSNFAFQSVQNTTTSSSASQSQLDGSLLDPFAWDLDAFGGQPTF